MSAGENIGVSLSRVVSELEEFAPKYLAESWDNTGLLVEPYTPRKIRKILLTNDLTEEVAIEANRKDCEMIISYHPPIFTPLKSVTHRGWKEQIIAFLLENRIALYSPHTCWDSIKGGVNDWLASIFPIEEMGAIKPNPSNPLVGAGRLVHLDRCISVSEAVDKVKQLTRLQHVRLAMGRNTEMSDEIKTVALCAGSGSSVLKGITADLYLTGEMLHHDVLDATQKGITVMLTNHSDSERGYLRHFAPKLRRMLENKVEVLVSVQDRDPLDTV